MRLKIEHVTRYAYDAPIPYAIQEVRLTPSRHEGQAVPAWTVSDGGQGRLPRADDGYGNAMHMHSINRLHRGSRVVAGGEVVTSDTSGVVRGTYEPLPLSFYRRSTPLTEPDATIRELAETARARLADEPVPALHDLMKAIRGRMDFRVGTTAVHTKAADALREGRGVCQDHAQVMIACARALGLPARYVSGYMWTGDDEVSEASHAWAEVHLDDLGWVGFDAANKVCPTEAYVRVATGLDYAAAAPIRGVRRGLAREDLSVEVRVRRLA